MAISVGGWLDALYTVARSTVITSAKSLNISSEGWAEYALLKGYGYVTKTYPKEIASTSISHKVAHGVDESLAQHLNVYNPIGPGLVSWDTYENIKKMNAGVFVNAGVGLAVGLAEDWGSTFLVTSIAAVVTPAVISASLPTGVVAGAIYLLAGKTIVDSLERSIFWGTVADIYKTQKNPFGIKGVTTAELEEYPEIKKLILSSNAELLNISLEITNLTDKISEITSGLNDTSINKSEYHRLVGEHGQMSAEFGKLTKEFKRHTENALEGYIKLERLRNAGFATKRVPDSVREFTSGMHRQIEELESASDNFKYEFNHAEMVERNQSKEDKVSISDEDMASFNSVFRGGKTSPPLCVDESLTIVSKEKKKKTAKSDGQGEWTRVNRNRNSRKGG
ncbi:MAG: hypothetical protein HOI53_07190 [Francisellaceae bacterium]|jgi:hypothetical protein|nr:hypothetical protein [Francisellaceae bacterium]MBT6207797.1 hypothetical protein [Francisellaceae bacterium]